MAPETRVLVPSDPDWDRWMTRAPHDFHHLASYHAFSERMGEGEARAVVHSDGDRYMAWPYLVRVLEDGHADASSVYGYTGPVGIGLDDAGFAAEAWAACRGAWTEQRIVTLFTRFHPLLSRDMRVEAFRGAADVAGGEVLRLGGSVALDLSLDRETRRMGYPQPLRQEIKRSEREGLTVEADPEFTHADTFARLYRGTMAENAASDAYMFSDAYLTDLRMALGPSAHLAVASVDGAVAGAMLFTVTGEIAQAHLTGSDPAHRRLSPLKLLIDRVAELSAARGARWLHLGAGRGGFEDSLYDFKARFSKTRLDFRVGRWILDAAVHGALTSRSGVDPAVEKSFFPAYRAPVGVAA